MHELSIAHGIVEAAEKAARDAGAERVDEVHLRLGELAGVVEESLLFCFDVAVHGTLLEGSRLVIEHLPVEVYCPECDDRRELPSIQRFCCPVCGTPTGRVVQGQEMELVSLEVS